MRTILAMAAFLLCFVFGVRQSLLLKRRAAFLEELSRMLSEFEIEIRFAAPTLDILCEKAEGDFADIIRECRRDNDIKSAWEQACGRLKVLSYCHAAESELMLSLGRSLGTSDISGQRSLIELHSEKLGALRKSASEESAKKGKLFRSVGALCGIGAAVLIM